MVTVKASKKVGKYVNTKHVDSLLKTYKKERWIHNSNRIGKADSLSVWYSVEELKEFLETAQNNGADGIKMYFGAYTKESAKDEVYEDRQTIVLVATKTKQTESGDSIDKSVYVKTEKGVEILAYNIGKLCPPYCGGSGQGFDLDTIGISIIDNKDGMIVV
jgi:hypothetical protein